MVKFMVDSFGSGREMSKEQAVAALHIPQEGEEVEEEEVESAAQGATPQQADVCSLADSKPAYPVDSDSLSTTGVPRELFSDNMPSGPSRQSTYYCLFGEPCSVLTHQKASIAAHLRRKHLGISIACKYCDCRWWTSNPFEKHMQKKHPEIQNPDWWTPIDKVAEAAKEAEAADAVMATIAPKSVAPLV